MPVIRVGPVGPASAVAAEAEMVDELAGELAAGPEPDSRLRQPIVIEQELPTGSLHVFVIWDQWRRLAARSRSAVIMRAYERALHDRVDRITIALPATVDEAVSLGLLPFAVRLLGPEPRDVGPGTVERAMRDEGGTATGDVLSIRLPTREAADAAIRRLRRRLPSVDWVIERQIRATDDSDDVQA